MSRTAGCLAPCAPKSDLSLSAAAAQLERPYLQRSSDTFFPHGASTAGQSQPLPSGARTAPHPRRLPTSCGLEPLGCPALASKLSRYAACHPAYRCLAAPSGVQPCSPRFDLIRLHRYLSEEDEDHGGIIPCEMRASDLEQEEGQGEGNITLLAPGAYSDSRGLHGIRKEVADFIESRNGYPSDPELIYLTDGASKGVMQILSTIIRNSNDGILVPVPQYPLTVNSPCIIGQDDSSSMDHSQQSK